MVDFLCSSAQRSQMLRTTDSFVTAPTAKPTDRRRPLLVVEKKFLNWMIFSIAARSTSTAAAKDLHQRKLEECSNFCVGVVNATFCHELHLDSQTHWASCTDNFILNFWSLICSFTPYLVLYFNF